MAASALWLRYAQPHWPALAELCGALPPADEPCSMEALEAAVEQLTGLLDAWLRTIGFELRDSDSGLYFDVLRHDF